MHRNAKKKTSGQACREVGKRCIYYQSDTSLPDKIYPSNIYFYLQK